MNPTISQLRMVISVAESGSFSDSARRALVSQPSLSRAVQEVEKAIGLRLFDRTTRSVTATAEGLEFVGVAKEIVRQYDEELGRFAAYRRGEFGTLTVTALPSLAAGMLPDLVGRFTNARPGVRVRILDGNASETIQNIRSGQADIAFTEPPRQETGLRVYPLIDDGMVALLPADHVLADRSRITWAELSAFAFISLDTGSSLRRMVDRAFDLAQVEPQVTLETRAIATAAGMVAAGLGVTAVTRSVLPVVSFVPWVAVPLIQPAMSRSLAVVVRDHPKLSLVARDFIEVVLGGAEHAARP